MNITDYWHLREQCMRIIFEGKRYRMGWSSEGTPESSPNGGWYAAVHLGKAHIVQLNNGNIYLIFGSPNEMGPYSWRRLPKPDFGPVMDYIRHTLEARPSYSKVSGLMLQDYRYQFMRYQTNVRNALKEWDKEVV